MGSRDSSQGSGRFSPCRDLASHISLSTSCPLCLRRLGGRSFIFQAVHRGRARGGMYICPVSVMFFVHHTAHYLHCLVLFFLLLFHCDYLAREEVKKKKNIEGDTVFDIRSQIGTAIAALFFLTPATSPDHLRRPGNIKVPSRRPQSLLGIIASRSRPAVWHISGFLWISRMPRWTTLSSLPPLRWNIHPRGGQ